MGQALRILRNERQRLLAVRSLISVESAPTPELATLAELAKGVFGVSYAAINIIDEDWQRIAGQAGLRIGECSREMSICTRVVFEDELLVIPDLTEDQDLRSRPYVVGSPHFRFYAGAPVYLDNLPVGSFCILDGRPGNLSDGQALNLRRFAEVASALLSLQKANLVMGLAHNQLQNAAITDPLTGLFNRSALSSIVDGALDNAMTAGQTFGALYLDMDGFKAINDKLGHQVGDAVLYEAANRIRSVIRAGDIPVRMGGDEFAVFVPNPPNAPALAAVSQRLVSVFREPVEVDGEAIQARISIGGALAPDNGRRRADLLNSCDKALYAAKRGGRDRFVVVGA
ncbi:diguanylate cyclase [Sinorhizobium medicae]|nr:diguanylate cyclase [Sinorhizobium medicae]